MYLPNKYTTWYKNIITNATLRVDHIGYFEKHHIIPKSIGGSNDPANLVKLTAKEHFICHMLLPKMTIDDSKSKMIRAAWMIATMGNKNQKRIKVTSRTYCYLKEQWLIHGNLNKPKTEQHKQNLRKPKPTGFGKQVSEYRTGKSWNHKHTAETKSKMSSWQKGIPKPKVLCEYCNKEISHLNYTKWHGMCCKYNPTYVKPAKITKVCEHCNKEMDIPNYTQWHGSNCRI